MSITDADKRAEALQPIRDYVDSLEKNDNSNGLALKSVVTLMKNAKDQLTTLVSHCFVSMT
jgi:hypothetical protein